MATVKEELVSKRRSGKHLESRSFVKAQSQSDSRIKPSMTVAIRQQTPEEERQWEMAFDVFLAELVRQHLGQRDK